MKEDQLKSLSKNSMIEILITIPKEQEKFKNLKPKKEKMLYLLS